MTSWAKFWRLLGVHVCWDFTPWKEHCSIVTRVADLDEFIVGVRKVKYSKRYQERKCKECGKIVQRLLDHGGPTKEKIGEDK